MSVANTIGLRIDNLWDELNDLRESDEPDAFKLYHLLGTIHGLQEAEAEVQTLIAELDKSDAAFSALKDQNAKADAELINLKEARDAD